MPAVEKWGEDRVALFIEYRERELAKTVPGARWSRDYNTWWVPLSWAACVQLRAVFGDSLVVGPELDAWARTQLTKRIIPCLDLREAEDTPLEVVNAADLEPRQRVGTAFMSLARRALIADGMGSGKTVQTISAVETLEALHQGAYPALVICPNSLVYKWEAEIKRWAPGRTVAVLKGNITKRRKLIASAPDWLIINWEGLRAHTRLAGYGNFRLDEKDKLPKELNEAGLRTVIADEAHRGKDPKAKQTRAWWWLAHRAQNRFALTGTPLANTPEDLWSIMHALEPAEWPAKVAFVDRYALQSWNNFGGLTVIGIRGERREELFKILDPRFIRRPTELVVPLPGKLPPDIREVELHAKQRKAYDTLRKELLAEIDSGVLLTTNPLARMMRLLQLAAAYGELDAAGNFRLAEPSTKLDALDDLLDELGDEQLVVFAESRQLIELAAARLGRGKNPTPFGLVTGAVDPRHRQEAVDRFQAGDLRVILLTLGAGGEGIDLFSARHICFLQRSFSMVKNRQAEDRVYRRGQTRHVQPIYFESRDTIEGHVRQVALEKEDRLEEVARDAETLRRWLS